MAGGAVGLPAASSGSRVDAVLAATHPLLTAVLADGSPGVLFQNQASLQHYGDWPDSADFLDELLAQQGDLDLASSVQVQVRVCVCLSAVPPQ